MSSFIAFLDIDGTLIDVDQRPTMQTLTSLIDELTALGVRFGLNSNRAHEDILPIVQEFHLTGPFILENGAYMVETVGSEPIVQPGLPRDIPQVVNQALREAVALLYPGATVTLADTVALVRQENHKPGTHFFMNKHRVYSASIHARFDGRMDFEEMRKLATTFNEYFHKHTNALHAVPHEHGATVTIEVPGIDKGTGLALIRQKNPMATLIAIGDGIGDLSLRTHVDKLYAVSNAIQELKDVADAVATAPMTKGVHELLDTHVRKLALTDHLPT